MYIIATIIAGGLRTPWTERVFADRGEAMAELKKAQEGPSAAYWGELQVYSLTATNGPKES